MLSGGVCFAPAHVSRKPHNFADDCATMYRAAFSITLIVTALILAGCQTPKQYMKQHGEADLISDETRDFYRVYLPGETVEKWKKPITTLYYLNDRLQVRFKQGQVKKSAIPNDELESLLATKMLLEAEDGGSTHLDW